VRASLANEPDGDCHVIGASRRLSPLSAALANGAVGNVLEMDDVDKRAILHPGPTVIPAALAAAERKRADAPAFLDSVVRGYEAVIRVGRAVGPAHYAYWHNTGTCGPFGAAAAAASAFQLSGEAQAHAFALAGTQASGFWQTRHEPDSHAKQLHTARAAHAGLLGAELAKTGFKGPLSLLEGPQGFFAATCPGAAPEGVLADYGADWLIHQVSFKPWPACRHAHAAIDAALAARTAGIGTEEIVSAQLVTYADATAFCDKPNPASVIEAKFSLQHSIAAALIRGEPQLEDFEPAIYEDPALRALAAKVSVQAGPPFDGAYPARYGAGLELTLTSGEVHSFSAPDALGDPENPISEERLRAKVDMLCRSAGMQAPAIDRLSQATLTLADGGDLRDYLAALPVALSEAAP
jgi:2-methylcitrate dehydratase PrpD